MKLELAKSLKCYARTTPYLYGLSKIHKHDIPIRLIVNYTSTPSFKLFKFLSNLLKPLIVSSLFNINSPYQYLRDLKSLKII